MQTITRDELQQQLRDNEQTVLVEVLGPEAFRKFHLPGAINVPVGDDFERNIQQAVPDKSTPVVVYCANKSCTASPKAAEKMDALGYKAVYDYEAGKEDWKQAGLPIEEAA